MGLLDRIRPQPTWQHADPHVRASAVDALADDQQELLDTLARTDSSPLVRRAALLRLADPRAIVTIATGDPDPDVRQHAADILLDLALNTTDEGQGIAAIEALWDPKPIMALAKSAMLEPVSRAALDRLADERLIAGVARRSVHPSIRVEALGRLSADPILADVALRTEHADVALAALDRIADPALLESIALRGRNKVAARRAGARLRALRSPSPLEMRPPTDRPRQIALCERLEALGTIADADRLSAGLGQARADWSDLAPDVDDDLADRFAAACAALRDRQTTLDAERLDRERRDREDAARQTERRVLCEQVDAIRGGDALDQLGDRQRQWHALQPWDGPEAAALEQQFVNASAACQDRHARWTEARTTLERLSADAEQLADDPAFPDERAARDRAASIRQQWRQLGEPIISSHPDLLSRFAQAAARLTGREALARDQRIERRIENLHRLEHLCIDVEALLVASAPSLKDLERRHREIKTTIDRLPDLPSKRDHDTLAARLKRLHLAVVPKLQELREASEWERWANAGVQEELCARTEALIELPDLRVVSRQLRDIEVRWRQAATAPAEHSQAFWRRFHAAEQRVRARLDVYFAQQNAERADNLQRREALCIKAEALQMSSDWLKTAELVKGLQAEWKTIGAVSRGQEKLVWERFRQACDRFFTRRHEDLARRKATWSDNLARKDALCVRAEALGESVEWDAALADIRRLQTEWRTIGPVRRSRADAIWNRFHAACEHFFERYQHRDRLELEARLADREGVCAELEALGPAAGEDAPAVSPEDLVATLQRLVGQWQKPVGLPRDAVVRLNDRFSRALDTVVRAYPTALAGSEFDADRNRQTMEALCARVERLVSSGVGSDASASPSARLATLLKEALASNTIGGRVDEEARWRAVVEDVKAAQSAWRRIGFVSEPVRRDLTARFERACRVFEEGSRVPRFHGSKVR